MNFREFFSSPIVDHYFDAEPELNRLHDENGDILFATKIDPLGRNLPRGFMSAAVAFRDGRLQVRVTTDKEISRSDAREFLIAHDVLV